MAKKNFKEQLKEQQQQLFKTDGKESTKTFLSPQAKGEKRKYTRLAPRENKTEIVTVLLTKREYDDFIYVAEQLGKNSRSEYIREMINNEIRAFKGAEKLAERRNGKQ